MCLWPKGGSHRSPPVTEDTADLAFVLNLAASRRLGQGQQFLSAGGWAAAGAAPAPGGRVHGQTSGPVSQGGLHALSKASGFRVF